MVLVLVDGFWELDCVVNSAARACAGHTSGSRPYLRASSYVYIKYTVFCSICRRTVLKVLVVFFDLLC